MRDNPASVERKYFTGRGIRSTGVRRQTRCARPCVAGWKREAGSTAGATAGGVEGCGRRRGRCTQKQLSSVCSPLPERPPPACCPPATCPLLLPLHAALRLCILLLTPANFYYTELSSVVSEGKHSQHDAKSTRGLARAAVAGGHLVGRVCESVLVPSRRSSPDPALPTLPITAPRRRVPVRNTSLYCTPPERLTENAPRNL